jgi:mRNA interferase MazF
LYLRDDRIIFYKQREIWWASLGINIGHEQNGKNNRFERPVLILKKFGNKTLWVLPLTSKEKTSRFYQQLNNFNHKSWIDLSQIRLISSKRLLRKITLIADFDFKKIQQRVKDLI